MRLVTGFHLRLLRHKCQKKRLSSPRIIQNVRQLFVSSRLCDGSFDSERLDGNTGNSASRNSTRLHLPVMKDEVVKIFTEAKCKTILDMTFGAGGHSRALLDAIPDCHIIALDRDPRAYDLARQLSDLRPGTVTPLHGKFSDLPQLFSQARLKPGFLDGVLLDAGSSSMQFDEAQRGFSLSRDGPLDMRMDGNRLSDQPTAADVVNCLDEIDLAKIFKRYGEDSQAKKIAHGIVEARSAFGRIKTTKELADIVANIFPGYYSSDKLGRYKHPATKVFQALRIFVNNELNELNAALEIAHQYLRTDGVFIAISFHSLEDRIIKRHFHAIDLDEEKNLSLKQRMRSQSTILTLEELMHVSKKKWEPLFRKIMVPTEEEVSFNPRSRSAKLRAAKRNDL